MCTCLQDAEKEVEKLKEGLQEIDALSKKMAVHFCEEETKFKLEECLDVFKQFCDKVKQCQQVGLFVASFVHQCFRLTLKICEKSQPMLKTHQTDLWILVQLLDKT